jgi:tetratricopeptide (TPR) repeat protein
MVPDKVERLLQRAQQAIAQRDWEKAKQVYLLALGLRTDLPDVHYGLATVFFQLRELTSAAHHVREVTRLDPLRAGAYTNLGAVLNLMGQYDDSISALRRAIQIDPQRVEAYYNLGLVYRRKGQPDLAVTAYKEAIRINPRMADAHLNLGNIFLEKEQYRQAAQHYETALELRPGWEKALDGLDHAREAQAQPAEEGPQGAVVQPAAQAQDDIPVDPVTHGALLTGLNQTSGVGDETGRMLQKILIEEVEPAIKELSNVLLHSGSRGELDSCLTHFETALQRLRTTRQALKNQMARLKEIGAECHGK